MSGSSIGPGKTAIFPRANGMVAGAIDGLGDAHERHVGNVAAVNHSENVVETGIHARTVEGRASALARVFQNHARQLSGRVWVVLIPVMSGNPVRRGDDVDTRFQDPLVELEVRKHAVERHHVRPGGDDVVDGSGRHDPDGSESDQFAGVASNLFRRIAVQSN